MSIECGIAEVGLDAIRALVNTSVVVMLRAASFSTLFLIVVGTVVFIVSVALAVVFGVCHV
jgi:hypothetical protein